MTTIIDTRTDEQRKKNKEYYRQCLIAYRDEAIKLAKYHRTQMCKYEADVRNQNEAIEALDEGYLL